MKSTEVKKFVQDTFKINVRTRTIPCKRKTIQLWMIEHDKEIPQAFCTIANEVIYGNKGYAITNIANQRDITMDPEQWEKAINLYKEIAK